jgi:transposase-like protein
MVETSISSTNGMLKMARERPRSEDAFLHQQIENARQSQCRLVSFRFAPEVLVTDKLRSYSTAKAEIGLSARHEQGLRKNNRAENSHQPIRRRERKLQRFKSPGSAQRFLSIHAAVHSTFNGQRHLTFRRTLRVFPMKLSEWRAAIAA